jgi:NADPH:quinone reductase-like Zn-dependent oxidoreductase
MKAKYVQVAKAGGPLELVMRDVPDPGAGEVRVRVEACGVCHSDSITVAGLFPSLAYPRVPGHEIVGTVDAVGSGVAQWKPGQRVGMAGTEDTVAGVNRAGAATSSRARIRPSPELPMTAAMPNMWSFLLKRSLQFRNH